MRYLILVLVFVSTFSFAQKGDVRFRASSYSNSKLIGKEWSGYSKWENCSVLILFSGESDKVTIFSNEHQEIDLYKFTPGEKQSDGSTLFAFNGVDKEGREVRVRHMVYPDKKQQIYIDYPTVTVVYNVTMIQ